MKVFISWSGDESRALACILRDWLPSVIQVVEPYVSSEDIDKGVRWTSDIASELEGSSYGIICVTKDNITAPWINFEAGALSKKVDSSNVSPFLFGVKRSEIHGPLLQFQSTVFEKSDVHKLVRSINAALLDERRLKEQVLDKGFDVWWPQLEVALHNVESSRTPSKTSEVSRPSEILEEVLDLVRQQQRLISNPESLLPADYVRRVLFAESYASPDFAIPVIEARLSIERVLVLLDSIPAEKRSNVLAEITALTTHAHATLGNRHVPRPRPRFRPAPGGNSQGSS